MKKKIFISYRRSESFDTKRLAEFLKSEFGPDNIFYDTHSINPGVDWPDTIKNSLLVADLMLLIIGPNWLYSQDEQSGKRRIDLDTDWVRREVITFMKRKKKNRELVLIPVLVNGAEMPKKHHLDTSLAPISNLQAIRLDNFGSSLDFVQIKYYLITNKIVPIYYPPVVTPISLPRPKPLTKKQEEKFTDKYPKWKFIQNDELGVPGDYIRELYGFFEFKSYEQAWRFITKVHKEAILKCNHHPRWQNTYNRVEFWLCTFNIDHKPSERDIELAENIEKIWDEIFAKPDKRTDKGGSKRVKQSI